MPEQSCVPDAQTPAHDAPEAMHAPAHSFIADGQVPPHIVPSQVAVPPVGTGQGTQAVPQVARSSFFTQIPTQLCVPEGQTAPTSGFGGESPFASTGLPTPGLSVVASTIAPPTPESLIPESPASLSSTRYVLQA